MRGKSNRILNFTNCLKVFKLVNIPIISCLLLKYQNSIKMLVILPHEFQNNSEMHFFYSFTTYYNFHIMFHILYYFSFIHLEYGAYYIWNFIFIGVHADIVQYQLVYFIMLKFMFINSTQRIAVSMWYVKIEVKFENHQFVFIKCKHKIRSLWIFEMKCF